MDTEGLLLLTNDGELANRLMHPRHHVDKEYRVVVRGVPSAAALQQLRDGIMLDDGLAAPAEVELLGQGRGKAELRMVIREGRKRQVRRMFGAIRHPVQALTRVRVGPVRLGRQAPGTVRPLTGAETAALKAAAGL
jgi:pseudouridine synthase